MSADTQVYSATSHYRATSLIIIHNHLYVHYSERRIFSLLATGLLYTEITDHNSDNTA